MLLDSLGFYSHKPITNWKMIYSERIKPNETLIKSRPLSVKEPESRISACLRCRLPVDKCKGSQKCKMLRGV